MDPITEASSSSSNIDNNHLSTRTTIEEQVEAEEQHDSVSDLAPISATTREEPILVERTRHSFSYTANELRQRNVTTTNKEAPTKTTTTHTTTHVHDNYKDDSNHNGGGFYECNIW